MPKCVLHIGMHKTGSSSIQRSLEGYRDDKFVYPQIDHAVTTLGLFSSDFTRLFAARQAAGKNRAGFDRTIVDKLLRQAIKNCGDRTMILSCEGIYANLTEADLVGMKAYLSRWFDTFEAVGYIRTPASYRTSAFQTVIKSQGVATFDLASVYKPYRRSFEKFDRVFGRENTALFKFQASLFPEGDVVRHFCQHIGLAIPPEKIVRINESLSRELVVILYFFNQMRTVGGDPRIDRSVTKLIATSGIAGSSFRLSPVLMEADEKDVEWIEQRLGQPMMDTATDVRPTDVASEDDLLRPDVRVTETLAKLAPLVADTLSPAGQARFAELVANWRRHGKRHAAHAAAAA